MTVASLLAWPPAADTGGPGGTAGPRPGRDGPAVGPGQQRHDQDDEAADQEPHGDVEEAVQDLARDHAERRPVGLAAAVRSDSSQYMARRTTIRASCRAKVPGAFDAIFAGEGLKTVKIPPRTRARTVSPKDGYAPHEPSAPTGCSSTANTTFYRSWASKPGITNGTGPISPASNGRPTRKTKSAFPLDLPVQQRKVLGDVINEYYQAALADLMNTRSDIVRLVLKRYRPLPSCHAPSIRTNDADSCQGSRVRRDALSPGTGESPGSQPSPERGG